MNLFYGYIDAILSVAKNDGGLIPVLKNKIQIKIIQTVINQITKDFCDPVIKVRKTKDIQYVFNKIVEITRYKDIKDKIENKKNVERPDYIKKYINENYQSVLNYHWISYEDFLDIEFLVFEDIIKTLAQKDLRIKSFILDALAVANSFSDGKAFASFRSELSRQLNSIEDSFKDWDKWKEARKRIKNG